MLRRWRAAALAVLILAGRAAEALAGPSRAELLERLAPADVESRSALSRALEFVLRSETGRERARAFARLDAALPVVFSTAAVPDGALGLFPELLGDTTGLAAALAREAFTYREGALTAGRRGLGAEYATLEDADTRADLVEALVRLELAGPSEEIPRWRRLAQSTATYASVYVVLGNRATLLPPEDLDDPCAAWGRHEAELARRRKHVAQLPGSSRRWRWSMDHFVKTHGVEPARLQARYEDISSDEQEIPGKARLLDEVEARLKPLLERCDDPVARRTAALKARPLAGPLRREVERLRARLIKALGPESAPAVSGPAPDTGELSFDHLNSLIQKDVRENPQHWSDAPAWERLEPWLIEYRPEPADPMTAQLLGRLRLADRGPERERDMLERLATEMLRSKTARSLAARFLALGEVVDVSFGTIAGSTVAVEGSTRYISGVYAQIDTTRSTAAITLNEMIFVATDRSAYVTAFTHELLGHGLAYFESKRAGVGGALHYLFEDELRALLIGAVTCLEAVGVDGCVTADVTEIARSTADYRASELFFASYWTRYIERPQLREACAVYPPRRAELERRRAHVSARYQEMRVWDWRFSHVVAAHRVDPRSIEDLRASVAATTMTALPNRTQQLDEAEPVLREMLDFCGKPEGARWAASLREAASSGYWTQFDGERERLRSRLISLLEKRSPPPSAAVPVPFPQLDWSDINKIYLDDTNSHPDHLAGEPPTPDPIPWVQN